MPDYRRAFCPGGTFFFTVNLLQRRNNPLLIRHHHPFHIHGWVVLPEHVHAILELPPGDADFSMRWRLIKSSFSKRLPLDERRSRVRMNRGERGIWQRRFWEHVIRDDADFAAHMDYLHFNPVKHGYVQCVADWPFSTFHRLVAAGVYPHDWAGSTGGGWLEHVVACPMWFAELCSRYWHFFKSSADSTGLPPTGE